jgi:hypothetical protein
MESMAKKCEGKIIVRSLVNSISVSSKSEMGGKREEVGDFKFMIQLRHRLLPGVDIHKTNFKLLMIVV